MIRLYNTIRDDYLLNRIVYLSERFFPEPFALHQEWRCLNIISGCAEIAI